jgi:hypothetical protein
MHGESLRKLDALVSSVCARRAERPGRQPYGSRNRKPGGGHQYPRALDPRYWRIHTNPSVCPGQQGFGGPQKFPVIHLDVGLLLYSGAVQQRRRLRTMSEPARELPADSPAVARAVENARQGVITHLTVGGKRIAAIVPESVIEALRAAEDAEDAAEADAAMDEPGESIPWEQVKAELDL